MTRIEQADASVSVNVGALTAKVIVTVCQWKDNVSVSSISLSDNEVETLIDMLIDSRFSAQTQRRKGNHAHR